MKLLFHTFLIFILITLLPITSLAYDCDHSRNIDKKVEVAEISDLDVLARAGLLEIQGQEDARDVQISAKLCAENKDDLGEMNVTAMKKGSKIIVETVIPRSGGWNDNDYKSIDLVMVVPARMQLDVDDSSGQATIKQVGALRMNDSSGALYIEDVGGDVEVKDSSGSLQIENVDGNIQISDSSGSIKVSDIGGEVHIEVDSSGEISAKNVGKSVIVDKDSSGSINVKNIKGDFIVRQDGSGGISYTNVAGEVDIPERKRKR